MIERMMTYYEWLMCQVMITTECDWTTAAEAVSSTAIEHPEWDLNARKTWTEWEEHEHTT